MSSVHVVDSRAVAPRPGSAAGLTVRPTIVAGAGEAILEQAILECGPGPTGEITSGEAEETLFVLDGAGTIALAGQTHRLEAETGVYLPRGARFVLESDGPGPLRLLAVRIPDPSPGPPARAAVRRLADQDLEPATSHRTFRVVWDPVAGLRSATQFVGYIPPQRAPEHFHTYDEALYVLEGEGALHAQGSTHPVAPGTCIALPARTIHVLESTGPTQMRVVGVFRPAGSPAAAFLPDGSAAFVGPPDA